MIKSLLQAIEEKTGLHMEQNHDFTELSDKIFSTLHEHISPSTLKRIWNYVKPMGVKPRISTLNILARFLGFKNFEEFRKIGGVILLKTLRIRVLCRLHLFGMRSNLPKMLA